jgi:hypothetical protein
MPPKLKRVGVLPPNDGSERAGGVNIDRRLKLTAIDDSCSHNNAVTSCDGTPGLSSVAATLCCDALLASFGESRTRSHRSAFAEQYPPLGGGTPEDVSFAETNGATEQLSNYLDSLSELEQRVCSIAKDHLESSFDLSRSTGYIAWKSNK